ncbi:NAD(P)H-dependent oxidoreductase subunit E [Roseitranquillus sediminis]|uniref:NAD(P)H-dependent oxidoreductase subunit E n=1 Tax=Roseitranquillus sediminis TaxID=2809051 RepID=UPI001D0CAC61|nr:NAD(P)H-dependent oxidoreductase subunit E [Roseitranquillus sediminis]MBM9594662.1 NAD(P)H-dependent oxidoreductase subunit E [Roseitranquillus sediminis]
MAAPQDTVRRGRTVPKGRQLDDEALREVRDLLGTRPRRRDLLIEHLHLIQDAHGHISAPHIRALAEEMTLPQAEIYEVATFYAHFDVVREGDLPPPPLTVRVCDSLSCEMAGARELMAALMGRTDPAEVRVVRAPCMGRCDVAPTAEVGHNHVDRATPEAVLAAVEAGAVHPRMPDYEGLDAYLRTGGYETLAELRRGGDPDAVQAQVVESGLRGLGGAGFPTGKKWSFVRGAEPPTYLAVNGDEGEPGTFKDRYYLERTPHVFLEGTLIAAWAVGVDRCYLYIRDEYPAAIEILRREIAALERAEIAAPGFLEIRRGAGAYICGEESAMLESIEGKRGMPRHRPPFVAQVGLWGRPTLVHNVETLYWVARVCREGPETLNGVELNGRRGLRSYSVSGRVRAPGMYLLPAGSTVRDVIAAAGGMADGHELKAYQPGGPSSGLLPARLDHLPLDFDTLAGEGSFIGSAAIVVLSQHDSARGAALNMLRFFEDESCGQCTPCRVGCEKAVKLMGAERWDRPLLEELAEVMRDASICGLGQAASNPFLLTMKHFPDEV